MENLFLLFNVQATLSGQTGMSVLLTGVGNQNDIIRGSAARQRQRLAVFRDVEGEDEVRFEISQLLWRAAVDRLAPNIGNAVAPINIEHCAAVGAPVERAVARLVDNFHNFTGRQIDDS